MAEAPQDSALSRWRSSFRVRKIERFFREYSAEHCLMAEIQRRGFPLLIFVKFFIGVDYR